MSSFKSELPPDQIASGRVKRKRLNAAARQDMIVSCAILRIASGGLENLRTRDVAQDVGINSATLHHHYPTKENLIEAVGLELERRFRLEKTDCAPRSGVLEALKSQFEDVLSYRAHQPELVAVYAELAIRARRDTSIARVVRRLDAGWLADICAIIDHAADAGGLRPGLNCSEASWLVFYALKGAATDPELTHAGFEAACNGLIEGIRKPSTAFND